MPHTTISAKTLTELFEKLDKKTRDRSSIWFCDDIEGSSRSSSVDSSGWNPHWDGKNWTCSIGMSDSISYTKGKATIAAAAAKKAAAEKKAAAAKKAAAEKKRKIASLKKKLSELEES